MRANPHTTTLEPLLRAGINDRERHHASKSSHDDPSGNPSRRTRPPNPSPCEQILTQRPGTTNGGRIGWVTYVRACTIRQTPSPAAISDAIRHIAHAKTYATCGIPYRLTSSPGHLTGYACQGIHDWTEPNNQQATKHTPGKSRMSRHTQLARKVRQVTPATHHPPRRVRPDIRNLTEPQPHRHPASAFDTPRMQRHTQQARSRAQSFPIQDIRQVTHAQTYTTSQTPTTGKPPSAHPANHACQDTHNQTKDTQERQNPDTCRFAHAQTYTTRRKAQNNCRICRHLAICACPNTHNTTPTAYTGCRAPTSDTPTAATPAGIASNDRRPIRPHCRRIISAYSSSAPRTRRSSQTRPRLPPDTSASTPAR